MSNKIKIWRKKDRKHFKPYLKLKKKPKFEIDPDPPRYVVVNGQYVKVE